MTARSGGCWPPRDGTPCGLAHIHAIVTAEGHRRLTTHVFDSASDYLDTDTVFGVKGSLVREFRSDGRGGVVTVGGVAGDVRHC